ncbi:MAG: peptidoglycan DD-metalloendopeptidase family protein [Paludibacter sp.]|nr:peptidoglycan DD-metalloendopeptidase family protein [Paludibacter sp.]MDD4198239.1 peptidoglycan DD-metalloendopeptidase family protein [Paludibacter sp.]
MRKILIIFVTLLTLTVAVGQTIKELEEQRKNALKRLETTSKVLSETKKTQRTSLNKLNIINKSISQRKALINNINKEISVLDNEITKLNAETRKLERELEIYKADYANMVKEAYINRSVYSKLLFLLSAESFDQSFRRLRYMQEYSEYRKEQMRKIENTKLEIAKKTEQLGQHKKTQVEIKNQKNTEQQKLIVDQKKENSVYANLKKKERTLQSDLKKQQRIANDLNRKIEALIAEEVRKAEEKRRAEEQAKRGKGTDSKEPATTPRTSEKGYAMTKEEKLISGNFAANAGRLPWPVERGFISGKYGIQAHPTLKYVTTNNKGIYIQTPVKTDARAVFDGIVTQRFSVPGSNNGVIIQHGQYRTVYANLTNIYVRIGQKIKAKQSIGQIYTDPESDNKTELFFQIWKDRTILNPESWIAR